MSKANNEERSDAVGESLFTYKEVDEIIQQFQKVLRITYGCSAIAIDVSESTFHKFSKQVVTTWGGCVIPNYPCNVEIWGPYGVLAVRKKKEEVSLTLDQKGFMDHG